MIEGACVRQPTSLLHLRCVSLVIALFSMHSAITLHFCG